jgi:adenosine deaminase
MRMVDLAANSMDRRVVGITLGGDERAYPAAAFAGAYKLARDKSLRLTSHAGEAAGPESIWDCLNLLGVDRIGHGTNAVRDPELTKRLADSRIHVECCISSNLLTGAVADVASHPIRELFDSGVSVSINTDDPAMFGVSVVSEIELAMTALEFNEREIHQIMKNTAAARFGDAGKHTV